MLSNKQKNPKQQDNVYLLMLAARAAQVLVPCSRIEADLSKGQHRAAPSQQVTWDTHEKG